MNSNPFSPNVEQSPSSSDPTVALKKKDFQVIFPQYIDGKLSPKQGRRLTKSQSVESPTMEEILAALQSFGYERIVRDGLMSYPRSQGDPYFPICPNECIRVAIKKARDVHYIKKSEFDMEEREPTVADIPTKMELLRQIAAWIKEKNPTRPLQSTADEVFAALPNPKIHPSKQRRLGGK